MIIHDYRFCTVVYELVYSDAGVNGFVGPTEENHNGFLAFK